MSFFNSALSKLKTITSEIHEKISEKRQKIAEHIKEKTSNFLSKIRKDEKDDIDFSQYSTVDEDYGICPITYSFMECPMLAPSGHYYEKKAIKEWLKVKKVDPLTRKPLFLYQLKEDKEYAKKIKEYKIYLEMKKNEEEVAVVKVGGDEN